MKKLFMFLAVAGMATFGASCSKSDDSAPVVVPPVEAGQLALTASKTTVEVGEEVTFTVKLGKDDVTSSSDIFVGDTKTGSKFSSDKPGEFKVVAKKQGAKDSAVVTIKVTEKGAPVTGTLVLKASIAENSEIEVGSTVKFVVTLDGAVVTSTSKLAVNGTAMTGDTFTATAPGDFTVVAKKDGSNDSNVFKFKVKEAVVVPDGNFLKVGNEVIMLKNTALYQFFKADGVNFRTVTQNGFQYVGFELVTVTRVLGGTIGPDDFQNFVSVTVYVKQSAPIGTEVTAANVVRPWAAPAGEGRYLLGGIYGAIGGVEFDADDETSISFGFPAAPVSGTGNWAFAIEGGNTETGLSLEADYEGEFEGYYNVVAPAARSTNNVKNLKAAYKTAVRVSK